jgi:putative membrane protein
MFYNNYFGGMALIWWAVWIIMIIWIFATPYNIPGQRHKKETALDILKKRFASGEITEKEYYEKKSIIEYQSPKQLPIL